MKVMEYSQTACKRCNS